MRPGRWLLPLGVAALVTLFAYLNRGERTTLHLGVGTLYRVPLPLVILSAILLGMLVMFLLGLRQDLRVRRILRENGLLHATGESEPPPNRI